MRERFSFYFTIPGKDTIDQRRVPQSHYLCYNTFFVLGTLPFGSTIRVAS